MGYESNPRSNAKRKIQKYKELVQQLKNDYFGNLSISALNIYDKSTTEFIDMMKMLKFDKKNDKLHHKENYQHCYPNVIIISSVGGTKNGPILNL